jgi:glycosyltransferase involved in cell wall biosynthesis/GT2 family glycosyltransferase
MPHDHEQSLSAPPATNVRVNRQVEPYSQLPLCTVSAAWSAAGPAVPAHLEVCYDGIPKSRVEVRATASAGGVQYATGTHLPLEADAQRVQVRYCPADAPAVTIADTELAALTPSATDAPPLADGLWAKVRRQLGGELFSLHRWQARFGRWHERLTELRLRLTGRLMARQRPGRSVHEAYVEHTALTPQRRTELRTLAANFAYRPKISILMPVYEVDPRWLKLAVDSVRGQLYDHWELCIADDASAGIALRHYLASLRDEPNVKVTIRTKNGHISAASNSAADLATGTFVALMDHDDMLAPTALLEIVRRLQEQPRADVIYSDEDKIDANGRRYDPQFKPAWSPDLLLSYNYINHFTCIRRSIFEAAGRFRAGYEGSQDHDLLLRVSQRTERFHHIPQILYHWRSLPTSTAAGAGVKQYVHTAGRAALHDHLAKIGAPTTTYLPPLAQKLNLPINLLDAGDEGPSVALVVAADPADADGTQLCQCLETLHARTTYRNYRVVVLVNPDLGTPAWLSKLPQRGVRTLEIAGAGNPRRFSVWANAALAEVREELVCFLAAHLEVSEPRWLSRLVSYLRVPGVAVAGPKVVTPAGQITHAGITLNLRAGTTPEASFAGHAQDDVSYYFYAEVARTVSAVGKQCLLARRSALAEVGGFEERDFPAGLAEVDLCQRLAERGQRTVYVGGATLVTHDRADAEQPGSLRATPTELRTLRHFHGRGGDRFYNPNLSDGQNFGLRGDCPVPASYGVGRPIRLLVAAHNLNNPEGAPRYLSEIVLGLRDRERIEPSVIAPTGGRGEGVYRGAGVPVHVFESSSRDRFADGQWTPGEYAAFLRLAEQLFREFAPEALLVNTLCCFPLVEAAARAGIPSVWIIHESYGPEQMATLFSPFARRRCEAAFALANRVVPASHDTAQLFAPFNRRQNAFVIHNGLPATEIDRYLARTSQSAARTQIDVEPGLVTFVNVGTVCERKGQHTLVEAAAKLYQQRDDFTVLLVGVRDQIPYASYVRHLVKQHGLEGVVRLISETDSAWPHLRAADAFVCTSHLEAYSRSILEAEAFGLPIISTACAGVSEQVAWGYNALRVPFNDPAALAERMARLVESGALRAELGRQSRAQFDNHLTYAEMLDRYEWVISSAAKPGLKTSWQPTNVNKAA